MACREAGLRKNPLNLIRTAVKSPVCLRRKVILKSENERMNRFRRKACCGLRKRFFYREVEENGDTITNLEGGDD